MKHALLGFKTTRPVSMFLLRQASICMRSRRLMWPHRGTSLPNELRFFPYLLKRKSLDFAFYVVLEHIISSSLTQFMITCCLDKACPVCDRVRCGTRNRQETQTSCPSQLEHGLCHCLDVCLQFPDLVVYIYKRQSDSCLANTP